MSPQLAGRLLVWLPILIVAFLVILDPEGFVASVASRLRGAGSLQERFTAFRGQNWRPMPLQDLRPLTLRASVCLRCAGLALVAAAVHAALA